MRYVPHLRPNQILLLACLALVQCLARPAWAQETAVEFELTAKETVIGVPVVLRISVHNAKDFTEPSIPEVDGAAVQPVPGTNRSSMTQIIGGRMTSRETITYSYRIVPSRTGVITIPTFTVKADGQSFTSDPIEIIVAKSDTSDLMFADIKCDEQSVYIGEPLSVTLRLWIRPYEDRRLRVRLDASDMLNLIDFKNTQWGDFTDEVPKLRDPFGQMRVRWREDIRADTHGNRHSYYLYEIPAVIWPQQAGALFMQPTSIIVTYPLRLGRNDAFLGMGTLSITESKPVLVSAAPPEVIVKAPPSENQPPTFAGAVGRFDFSATVKPQDVSVGDPITLTMTVIDRTPAPGARMDLLPPPALERVEELTENFRIPSDPLAGSVSNQFKTFTQTIRAKSDGVKRVPPIAFTYFDPESEQFVTRYSEAMPISVKPAPELAMSSVVAATNPTGLAGPGSDPAVRGTDLTEVAGGILANYADVEAMLTPQRFQLKWTMLAIMAAPPALLSVVALRRWTVRSRSSNAVSLRRKGARRAALTVLNQAPANDHRSQAHAIIAALGRYIADRFNLPSGTLATGEIQNELRSRGAADELVREAAALLEECDQLAYAGGHGAYAKSLADRCRDVINRLDRSRLR